MREKSPQGHFHVDWPLNEKKHAIIVYKWLEMVEWPRNDADKNPGPRTWF